MKYILTFFFSVITLYGGLIKSSIVSVDDDTAIISIDDIQKGVSGFVVRRLAPDHSSIIASATVEKFDKSTHQAVIKLGEYTLFANNNLPKGKWKPKKGDLVILAFGYNRALLIAPTEKIYYTLKNALKDERFIHPDVFATMLSFNGHPSPLKKDFQSFCNNVSIGLVFFFLEQQLYTVDCQSFHILDTQNAPLKQDQNTTLPFYTRVEKINANWFGEGSDEIEDYGEYYYELLYKENKNNKKLIDAIKHSDDKALKHLVDEIEEEESQ